MDHPLGPSYLEVRRGILGGSLLQDWLLPDTNIKVGRDLPLQPEKDRKKQKDHKKIL